jgi:integrase
VFARARLVKERDRPMTVHQAYTAHVGKVTLRASTRRDYASLWRLVPLRMQGQAIADIATQDLERLHGAVSAKHLRTANKLLALLSVLLRRYGRRHDNPAAGIARNPEEPRQRVLTLDELHRLREAIEREPGLWCPFFTLLLVTGARRGALARMQWTDLDLDAATWRIPAVWSKNRKVLTVALPSEAVAILRRLQCERSGVAPWVFPSRSKPGHLSEPKKAWSRICARASIGDARIHDLRRTLGTAIASDGANAAAISAALGHLSQQSARSYLHLSVEAAREFVERAARRTRRAA